MKDKRDKAFLGALIGGTIGLAGSAISGIINRNSQKRQLRREQIAQNKKDTYEMANNLTAGYGNQDYVNDFQKKVSFRNGGKVRLNDRFKYAKRFKHGGRTKCKLGWSDTDTSDVIGGSLSGLGSIITSAIANKPIGTVKQTYSTPNTPKEGIEAPSYINNSLYSPRQFRVGGKYRNTGKIR